MRILILSDSHHGMNFMEECAFRLKPDCILHLGDYYADGFDLKQEFPKAEFYQVPGNCDAYGCSPDKPLILMHRRLNTVMFRLICLDNRFPGLFSSSCSSRCLRQ